MKTNDEIDRLISMDDREVRKHVGECFRAQLRSNAAVGPTFFPGATVPNPAPPSDLTDYVGHAASALVAWSLSVTAAYGFHQTADGEKAKRYIIEMLNSGPDALDMLGFSEERDQWAGYQFMMLHGNEFAAVLANESKFRKLAAFNYDALFAQYCTQDGVTFQRYLNDEPTSWGEALAETLTSSAFIVTRALLNDADPSNFYQGLYLLLYKVYRLAPSRLEAVINAWAEKKLVDLAPKSNTIFRFEHAIEKLHYPWTNYEDMKSYNFSEQTFLSEVQNTIGRSEETNRWTESYPMSAHSVIPYTYQVVEHTFGKGAAEWLSQRRGKYEFLTGTEPSNKVNKKVI